MLLVLLLLATETFALISCWFKFFNFFLIFFTPMRRDRVDSGELRTFLSFAFVSLTMIAIFLGFFDDNYDVKHFSNFRLFNDCEAE